MVLRQNGQEIAILTHICQLPLLRKTGQAVVLSVVKSVPNRLRITPPNAFSRTPPTEKTVSAMRSIWRSFGFGWRAFQKKTVRNTLNLSGYRS